MSHPLNAAFQAALAEQRHFDALWVKALAEAGMETGNRRYLTPMAGKPAPVQDAFRAWIKARDRAAALFQQIRSDELAEKGKH